MYDAHIHLDQYPAEQLDKDIESWKKNGINGVLAVSTNLSSAYQTLGLRDKYPDFVHAALGYHPEQALPDKEEFNELSQLIKQESDRIAAIGEIGLPHYSLEQMGVSTIEPYLTFLESFILIAKELQLPVILHAVHDKAKPAYELLTKHRIEKAHFHWLKASPQVVKQISAAGYYISVTPEVCYRKRDQQLLEMIPSRQLLLETDGPWPFSGPFADYPTTPLLLYESAKKTATIKNVPVGNLIEQCDHNFRNLFTS